jgi:transcription antitermination factor NusG
MQKVLRQWSDRKKRVEVPLFNSYIFVRIPYHRTEEVLQVPGVAWAIRHNGKPAELQVKEYDVILRFLETGLLIEDIPAEDIEIGEQVEVMDGALKGLIGQVEGKGSGKFIVVLQALGRAMRVEVKPLVVRKI